MTRTDDRPRTQTGGLRVHGLRMSYGPVEVLRDVRLVVPSGGLTAVVGPSGCGKTTLLRLIAGFDRPATGTITIGGRRVVGPDGVLPPERRRVGYVTQEGNLFPHLTVAQNVAFGLTRPDRRNRRAIAELLELVGLDAGYARRHPHQLSGGQQQRVALARALAPKPGIVLLDEPFSALDAELREATRRAVVAALTAQGATTLLVTHDRSEALSLATRVAVLWEGRVAQEATPEELYRRPADRAVAAFVGDVVALAGTVRARVAECALGALPVAGEPPDGPATVLIRPEQVTLAGGVDGTPARVLDVQYYGHDAVLRLILPGGQEITARLPGHQLPEEGTQIRLTIRGDVAVDQTNRGIGRPREGPPEGEKRPGSQPTTQN